MGLDAQVIAIGPFSADIASALEYDVSFYTSVEQGTPVVSNIFIAGTSSVSHELAAAFGVNAMDLGKHRLNPEHANIAKLIEVFGKDNVEQFQCLAHNGFSFFYLPNA
jgi:hypothetical protein